jgi:aminoglycoside phosphotransferase
MRPLRHSYTNHTVGDGVTVVKCYQEPGALARSRREQAMLDALQGQVPVPQILDYSAGCLTMTFMNGIHGQELLDAGWAGGVLRACGTMLWRIHQFGTGGIAALATAAGDGQVLVHGDYGPQNVLLDPGALEITAVLDWEWAHAGHPVEDIAWCEWIIRMHHPRLVSQLGVFFGAYGGAVPPWQARQAAMLGRCRSLLDLSHQQQPGGPGETQWALRLAVTRAWQE